MNMFTLPIQALSKLRGQLVLKEVLLLLLIGFISVKATGQAPTLGSYSNTTTTEGDNVNIIPSAFPTNTLSITAFTDPSFKGTFMVDQTSGTVTLTNASLSGTYTVTVKAFGNNTPATTAVSTFVLTVNPGDCGQLSSATDLDVGSDPKQMAISDFNGDGNQDIAVISGNNEISILLGTGTGGFGTASQVDVYHNPKSLVIGDFNEDGHQD
ncbi:MAG: hypothetical protein ACI956_001590, partial [Nonlabens sp.]